MADLAIIAVVMGGFWGFSQATRPLPLQHFPPQTKAENCAPCHPVQYQQWNTSRHALAWNNEVFQHGFAREPGVFCVHCHAPTAPSPSALRRARDKVRDEGVSCAVCHVRHGKIVSAQTEDSPHDTVARPELGASEFCANCHEFNFVDHTPDGPVVTDLIMQTTYSEWLTYREAGGERTCQGCHMPNGDHSFAGVHRDMPIMHALSVECSPGQLDVRNAGAGHAIPTGDVFRELKIETQTKDEGWGYLHAFRKIYDVEIVDGHARKYIKQDHRLLPGATAEISLPPDTTGLRFRLQYSPVNSKIIAIYTVAPDGSCVAAPLPNTFPK